MANKQTNNQKEISEIIETKLPEVEDWEESYGQTGARRDKKKTREIINEKIGGTLAGQQQRMKTNLGYKRDSQKWQSGNTRMNSKKK